MEGVSFPNHRLFPLFLVFFFGFFCLFFALKKRNEKGDWKMKKDKRKIDGERVKVIEVKWKIKRVSFSAFPLFLWSDRMNATFDPWPLFGGKRGFEERALLKRLWINNGAVKYCIYPPGNADFHLKHPSYQEEGESRHLRSAEANQMNCQERWWRGIGRRKRFTTEQQKNPIEGWILRIHGKHIHKKKPPPQGMKQTSRQRS